MTKQQLLGKVGVKDTTFRSAAEKIGGKEHDRGLHFFDVSGPRIKFGPGAGLMLGISIGTASMRAALVDANGHMPYRHECESSEDQLAAEPKVILDRIAEAAGVVVDKALTGEHDLLVDGKLPMLGVAVAWPTPINREGRPEGRALAHSSWRGGQSLRQRVARRLKIDPQRSHAINDAEAAAAAVAFDRTHERDHITQDHPELTMVLRLAGGIGGATIVIEPPQDDDRWGTTSGFEKSVLIGGDRRLAGELGHATVASTTVDELNKRRPKGLRALKAHDCSCMDSKGTTPPPHLEAHAAAQALARRIDPNAPASETLAAVLAAPSERVHARALRDVGSLVGDALLAPVAWLNPARIVLTGCLATSTVAAALDDQLADAHPIINHPEVLFRTGEDGAYIRAKGASLLVLREHVFREFGTLLADPKKTIPTRLRALTEAWDSPPWAS